MACFLRGVFILLAEEDELDVRMVALKPAFSRLSVRRDNHGGRAGADIVGEEPEKRRAKADFPEVAFIYFLFHGVSGKG